MKEVEVVFAKIEVQGRESIIIPVSFLTSTEVQMFVHVAQKTKQEMIN